MASNLFMKYNVVDENAEEMRIDSYKQLKIGITIKSQIYYRKILKRKRKDKCMNNIIDYKSRPTGHDKQNITTK